MNVYATFRVRDSKTYVKKWHMMPAAMPVLCGQSRYNPVDLLSDSECKSPGSSLGLSVQHGSVLVARKVLKLAI